MICFIDIGEALTSTIITAAVMGLIGLISHLFKKQGDESKSRIDQRAKEIDRTNQEVNNLKERITRTEAKVESLEHHFDKIEELIKQNHKDLTIRMDNYFK
jgi:peptidoglycan hydrolase CwlO-like protein